MVIVKEEDYLAHYGVLGMKWGVRKDANKAYGKASKKLYKLDRKVEKASKKSSKLQQKSLNAQIKSDTAILFKKSKANRAANATSRAYTAEAKVQRAKLKAFRWHQEMNKVFKDKKVSTANPDYIRAGKKYSKMTLEGIMSESVTSQALRDAAVYYNRNR